MSRLNGKVAVITGGSSGIGLATARRFVDEGAHVFITGRRQEPLERAKALLGREVSAVQGDAADPADLDRLYAQVKAQKGSLDIVFANAGTGEFATIDQVTGAHMDKILRLNVYGTLFTVQKALPLIKDGGSIILTGSIASAKGFPAFGVYNASKAALRSFARTWANELKGRRIRVNVVSPGPTETAIFDELPPEAKGAFVSLVPRGTIGTAEEIAAAVLFLASDESSFVNGIELQVDGGTIQI